MNTLNQLARRYRQLCKGPARIDQQLNKLKEEFGRLQQQKHSMLAEIDHTKQLLLYCVVSGESPAEAALRHTRDQIQTALEEHQSLVRESGFYYDPSHTTIGSISITNHGNWSKPVSVTGGIASAGTISINSGTDIVTLNAKTP